MLLRFCIKRIDNKHCKLASLHKLVCRRFYNITRECVLVYLSFCDICKRKPESGGRAQKPKLQPKLQVKKLNGRVYVSFIEQHPINDYHFIMMYIEYATKFCHVRAITDLKPATIAIS